MGCSTSREDSRRKFLASKKQASLLAPTLHYSVNFVPQAACLNSLNRPDLESLYKTILSPFQLKALPFSNGRFLDSPSKPPASPFNQFEEAFEELQAELIAASETWPLNTSDSIFVFMNEVNSLQLKVLIAGPEYTPYAHGLFEFDILLHGYPEKPPKVAFLTNGNNKICFGPRLSNTGKVKLPILGTSIASHHDELWNSEKSVSELLFMLQGLIKTNNICEGDMELESLKEDEEARRKLNKACGNIVRYCNIKFAMLEYIRNPAPWLRDFVHTYFYLKKDLILKETKKWLAAALNDDGSYDGLASMYNPRIANELGKGRYHEKLQEVVLELEKELGKIRIHIDSPILQNFAQRERVSETSDETNMDDGVAAGEVAGKSE